MRSDIFKFFSLQKRIFGVCHNCNELFRLSDSEVYVKDKPQKDWMDALESKEESINAMEERLNDKQQEMRQAARKKGRDLAQQTIKKIDYIFAPKKISADDAKVLFHPIDYVIFDGLSKPEKPVKKIIFYDRKATTDGQKRVQENLNIVISKKKYEFITLKVSDDGTMKTH
ncbi:MAG TPA: Holliday junction resolvase-like protein [bacterium]|nr:Holliday junction resolvase-like protein [bacterium]